jgi:hypothetical protein
VIGIACCDIKAILSCAEIQGAVFKAFAFGGVTRGEPGLREILRCGLQRSGHDRQIHRAATGVMGALGEIPLFEQAGFLHPREKLGFHALVMGGGPFEEVLDRASGAVTVPNDQRKALGSEASLDLFQRLGSLSGQDAIGRLVAGDGATDEIVGPA